MCLLVQERAGLQRAQVLEQQGSEGCEVIQTDTEPQETVLTEQSKGLKEVESRVGIFLSSFIVKRSLLNDPCCVFTPGKFKADM